MHWLVLLSALALVACAHGAPSVSGDGAAERAAEAYDSRPSAGFLLGDGADDALRAGLAETCTDAKLTSDGRLAELARAVLRVSGGAAPSAALVSFHAQRLGIPDPTPQLWLANASTSAAVLPALSEAVRTAAGGESLTHCGGAAVRGGHGLLVAVALSRRLLDLDAPIPRRVEVGATIPLSGTLARGYDHASLAITAPGGEVERIALGRGRKLETSVRLAQRGPVMLEVLANGAEGVTVVALLAIAVGVEPEHAPPRADGAAAERDPAAVAEVLAALIARERSQRNLPPLAPHAGLRAVAEAHTDDMLTNHFVAHTSKQSGEAQDRVARAGLRSVVLLENIGRGYSASEIHAGLMESPGHRANILNRDVTQLGIAVGAEPEGERLAFVATELFARLAQPTNLGSAARDLFASIEAKRKARGLSGLKLDSALSRAAQGAAESFAREPRADQEALLGRATRGVRALPAGAKALSAALVQAEELAQVAESEQLLSSELTALGIGVAALPEGSERQLAIVLLLALRR
jgi:uncharacterized protein YkwD